MPGWEKRLWGDNYAALLAVKQRYDPGNLFACHHCIGDNSTDESESEGSELSAGQVAGIAVGASVAALLVVVIVAAIVLKRPKTTTGDRTERLFRSF